MKVLQKLRGYKKGINGIAIGTNPNIIRRFLHNNVPRWMNSDDVDNIDRFFDYFFMMIYSKASSERLTGAHKKIFKGIYSRINSMTEESVYNAHIQISRLLPSTWSTISKRLKSRVKNSPHNWTIVAIVVYVVLNRDWIKK